MENIFKNAKFGDRFITRDGHMAVFSSGCLDTETETVHLLVNYPIPRLVRYDYNGVIRDSDLHNADIIGSWDDWHDVNDEMPPCDDTWGRLSCQNITCYEKSTERCHVRCYLS